MTTYALIPGAGGAATWYWHRVTPLLEQSGHRALPVNLPGEDERAGLAEYAALVRAAIDGSGAGDDVVLVAQSMGGFTAPLVAAQVPLRAVALVNAMIPVPGERAGEWWEHTGAVQARTAAAEGGGYSPDFDEAVYFQHDLPPEVVATGADRLGIEADLLPGGHLIALSQPGPLAGYLLSLTDGPG